MSEGRKRIFAALIVLLMVAAGCGASDSDDAAGAADASSDDVQATESEEAADESADDAGDGEGEAVEASSDSGDGDGEGTTWETYESPISSFLGMPSFAPGEDSEEQFAEQEREVQASVTECMTAQGFEYYPEDPDRFGSFVDPFDEEWGTEEWTKVWGFGVTTQAFGQSQVGPELLGYPDDEGSFPTEEELAEDPNQVYVSSLSEGELDAYNQALYGDAPEITQDMSEEEIDELYANYEPTGCFNEAYEDVWSGGADEAQLQAFDEEFGEELNEMYERALADPRVQAETDKINDCMIAAGQPPMPEDGDYWSLLYTELEPLQEEVWGSWDAQFEDEFGGEETLGGEGLDEAGAVEAVDEAAEDFFFEQPELSDEQRQRLGELQANEIELATTLVGCGGSAFGGLGESEVFFEVMLELEQQFLDDNAAALEQYQGAFGG